MKKFIILLLILDQCFFLFSQPKPFKIIFAQNTQQVEIYDFIEITLNLKKPVAPNPFTDVVVKGEFSDPTGKKIQVDGFCDSPVGSLFKVRFMPSIPGDYTYSVVFRSGDKEELSTGSFKAVGSNRKGVVRVDKNYPFHFIWEGTGEHFFWNGTTTYCLLGWHDDNTIFQIIDRLSSLKVNYLRVAINNRIDSVESEPLVKHTDKFTFTLNPWLSKITQAADKQESDVTRFNLDFWQHCEKAVAYARSKNVIISIIFYVDGYREGVDPFGKENSGNNDEKRYYQYTVSRLSAYSNIMWDISNEYFTFRTDEWVEKMGTFIKEHDPYDHLTSVHGWEYFRFRTSKWADLALYQRWDGEGGNLFMLNQREIQTGTGKLMPQVNEEYGYEGHYPPWGNGIVPPGRSAENRTRLALSIYMSGCYQTTGERADEGTGAGKDKGGGWLNGRGDSSMIMLNMYSHIVDIFNSLEYWKMEPKNELVNDGSLCLAEKGKQYLIYGSHYAWIKNLEVKIEYGTYSVVAYNFLNGEKKILTDITGTSFIYALGPFKDDWVFVLKKKLHNNNTER